MESLLKNIIPTSLYLKWFNPKEDLAHGNNVYLHIYDSVNNSTFSLKFKHGVSRYDVVAFLKELHDKKHQSRTFQTLASRNATSASRNNRRTSNTDYSDDEDSNNSLENDDIIKQECNCLFQFYSEDELNIALNLLKVFTKDKFIFFGESNISVAHDQDDDNKLWFTHFYKNTKFSKEEHTECIACICNSYTYVFDN